MFARVESYFNSLQRYGPGQGYCPEPSKRVLIVHPEISNPEKVLACVMGLRFARVRIILEVLSRMTIPNVIG